MTQVDEITLAWAAGLFEGEGSIGIKKGRLRAHIQMTDLDILERMQQVFGGSVYTTTKQKEHHKQAWVWTITKSAEVMVFLDLIEPYMGARRSERIAEAREAFKSNRDVLADERIAQITSYRNSGLRHREIAAIVGCSRETVTRVLNRTK